MRTLLYGFFFISGACALVYEIAWVRVLTVDFGNTVYAVSTVLTIFMSGLALGNSLLGRWIDRGHHPLKTYALLELAIGAYAIGFALGIPALHSGIGWLLRDTTLPRELTTAAKFLVSMIVLLPPATFMGGTLPVLAKFVTDSPETIGLRLGRLYAVNTLGAVVGCLGEAFYLVLAVGVQGSIILAASLNVLLGVVCWFLAKRPETEVRPSPVASEPQKSTTDLQGEPSRPQPSVRLLTCIAFLSGFVTLATEVLWTRLLVNLLTGNVLVFATILGAFLTGLSVGAWLVARVADRVRNMDAVMSAVLLAGALLLAGSVPGQILLGNIFGFIHKQPFENAPSATAYLCLATLYVAVVIPSIAFGAVIPLLVRWGTESLQTLGRDVGRLFSINTIGAIAGSFTGGFILIRLLGVNSSLMLLAAVYAGLAVVAAGGRVQKGVSLAAAVGCIAFACVPSVRQPIYWFNGGFNEVSRVPDDEVIYLEEGVEATVGVTLNFGTLSLTVNGLIVAESTQADLWDLLLKAHLPMLLHENPREVALVGLGAGVSLGAVAAYDVDHIDCIEISPEVEPAHRFFRGFNGECWTDPRLQLTFDDGRQFLLTTSRRYDVISVDPVDPPVCNQYTQDFFQLCHDRLNPEGLMVQWVPMFHLGELHLKTIMRAFANVFAETTMWYDGTSILLIGKRGGPLEINVERFVERGRSPSVQRNLGIIGNPDPLLLLSTFVCGPDKLRQLIGTGIPDNTDNFPFLEYALLLAGPIKLDTYASNLEMLVPAMEPLEPRIRLADRQSEAFQLAQEVRRLIFALIEVRVLNFRREFPSAEAVLRQIQRRTGLNDLQMEQFRPFFS